MPNEIKKPIIGFTCGDINGIGMELIIKTLSNHKILDLCTPVVFANNKCINFYKKVVPDQNFVYASTRDLDKIHNRQVNIFNCWDEDISITPGQLTDAGGKYALLSLKAASEALKSGKIHAMVTSPIHKKNVQSESFPYTGHTPFLKEFFGAKDVVMFMVSSAMRIGLVTEHLPISEVSAHINEAAIKSKLEIMNTSLRRDFAISKPKIAVLSLNPHTGDEGLIGSEELEIINPTLKSVRDNHKMLVFGPYSSDAFFARGMHEKFDGILAMYHDQGLIPFKSLSQEDGVNFTAGLGDFIRVSPDHGVAFDIAGKGEADPSSFLSATFLSIDILRNRKEFDENQNCAKPKAVSLPMNEERPEDLPDDTEEA